MAAARLAELVMSEEEKVARYVQGHEDKGQEPPGGPTELPDEEADCLKEDERVMRRAIQETEDGRKAKTSVLIKAARISRQRALKALRRLEESGEYEGFAKAPPVRRNPAL
jgi:hypothetical protein